MAKRPTALVRPRRDEVYLVNFDPTLGVEIQKTRPALIVQNDVANRHSAITIVAAITSHIDYPPLSLRGVDSSSRRRPKDGFRCLAQSDPLDRQAKACATIGNVKAKNNGSS